MGGKYYLNNHLMFKVLVHETNGQYTLGKGQSEAELEAAAAVEVRRARVGVRAPADGRKTCAAAHAQQPATLRPAPPCRAPPGPAAGGRPAAAGGQGEGGDAAGAGAEDVYDCGL